MGVSRFEVHLVNLDPTFGKEIRKTRPCLVTSPDDMNHAIRTVDQRRLVRKLGRISRKVTGKVIAVLGEMFAE